MTTKIRLSRRGTTKRPFYWLVVANSRSARDGKFIEKLGTYNPLLAKDNPEKILFKDERIQHWLATGAQISERVLKLFGIVGIAVPAKITTKAAKAARVAKPPRKKAAS